MVNISLVTETGDMTGYVTIKERSHFEYEDRKSVFIGEAMPVSTEVEALASIDSVKKRYSDARHHVYAYVLRENSIMRFSDDREPQGTAGMPVLDTIRKHACTDTVIVVTRYFGGTLLGTGGLVRAYTSAAIGALERAEIIRYDIYSSVRIPVEYSDFGRVSQTLSDLGFRTDNIAYDVGVTISGTILKSSVEDMVKNLTELSSGRIKPEFLGEKFDY